MKKYVTWGVWACLYVVCVCLGMVDRPEGFGAVLCTAMAIGFFVPGGLLLYWGHREDDRRTVRALRWIAAGSLTLTLVLLILNFLSVNWPLWAGTVLHVLLVLVSVPMICSGYWVASLFLWACLLMASFVKLHK